MMFISKIFMIIIKRLQKSIRMGGKMKLLCSRGRELEEGSRIRIEVDIPSADGMLYKDTIVKLDEINQKTKQLRVTDRTGKVWWIEPSQVSASFL